MLNVEGLETIPAVNNVKPKIWFCLVILETLKFNVCPSPLALDKRLERVA